MARTYRTTDETRPWIHPRRRASRAGRARQSIRGTVAATIRDVDTRRRWEVDRG